MLKNAKNNTENNSKAIEEMSKKVDQNSDKLKKNAEALGSLADKANQLAQALTTITVGLGFWDTFDAFTVQEEAENRLRAALQANGREVESLFADYAEFASSLQAISTTGDEASLVLLQQAESLGVTGKAAKRAVTNAVALADAFGKSTSQTIMMTTALEQGNTMMLSRYFPTLRNIEDETEKVAEAQRLLGNMIEVTKIRAQSSAGQIQQLKNSWGDFKEQIGATIAQVLNPLVAIVRQISDEFQKLPGWMKKGISTTIILTAGLAGLAGALVIAHTAFGVLNVSLLAYITRANMAIAISYGLRGALILGAAYGFYEATKAILGTEEAIIRYELAIQDATEAQAKWAKGFDKDTNSIVENIDKIQNPKEKKTALERQLKNAKKELSGYEKAAFGARKEMERLARANDIDISFDPILAPLESIIAGQKLWNRMVETIKSDPIKQEAKRLFDEHNEQVSRAETRVEKLEEAYKKLNEEQKKIREEGLPKLKELTDSLREQQETLGMTANQIRLYRFELEVLDEQARNTARSFTQLNTILNQLHTTTTSLEGIRKDIETEISKIINPNMHPIEFKIEQFKLSKEAVDSEITKLEMEIKRRTEILGTKMKMATPELITPEQRIDWEAETQAIINMRLKLNDVYERRKDIQKIVDTDLTKELELLKTYERANSLIKEANELNDRLQDPFDRHAKELLKLRRMLSLELITEEIHQKAVKELEDKLKDATAEARKLRNEFQRINGVEFFSLEGKLRIEELLEDAKRVREEFRNANKGTADDPKVRGKINDAIGRLIKESAKSPAQEMRILQMLPDIMKNIRTGVGLKEIQEERKRQEDRKRILDLITNPEMKQGKTNAGPNNINPVPAINMLGNKQDTANKFLKAISEGINQMNNSKNKGIVLAPFRFVL